MATGPDLGKIRQALIGTEYPCARDVLLRNAAARDADDETLGHLGALPEGCYSSFEEVGKAIDQQTTDRQP